MNRLLNAYCKVLSGICALLMAAMVVLVFGNVVLRYVFNTGWLISEEVSRWFFVWMVFIGSIVALRERAHLGTDMVVVRLSPRAQRVCAVLAQLIMLYISWLLLSGSWTQVQINSETNAPVSNLPLSFFYFCGVVFAVSTLVILLENVWRTLRGGPVTLLMAPEGGEVDTAMLPPETASDFDSNPRPR